MTDRLTIYINRKKKVNKAAGSPRGPILNPRKSELLPRPAQNVNVNFVDLGQWWNGSNWVDVSTLISPNISFAFGSIFIDNLTSTDWGSLRSDVLALISVHGYESFRPLTFDEAEKYGLDFYIGENFATFDSAKYFPIARVGSRKWVKDETTAITANAKWTEDGLKVKKGTSNFQIWSHNAFLSPKTVNSQLKITSSSVYTDPAAPFKFNHDTTFYLMPKLVSEFGWSKKVTIGQNMLLNAFYVIVPRQLLLSRDFDWTTSGFAGIGSILEYTGVIAMPAFSSDLADFLTFMKARSGARVFDTQTGGFVALSNFPLIETGEPHWDAGWTGAGANPGITGLAAGISPIPAGTLVAIIKQGSNTFYAWHDSTTYQNNVNKFNRSGT